MSLQSPAHTSLAIVCQFIQNKNIEIFDPVNQFKFKLFLNYKDDCIKFKMIDRTTTCIIITQIYLHAIIKVEF